MKDCMNKIIRDLKQAKKLLSEVDIIPENGYGVRLIIG